MDCSSCGHTNRAGARFCEDCGRPVAATCPACEAELRPTAKFCDQCGTPVERSPAPLQPTEPAGASGKRSNAVESGGDAVRKTVTVLFCDVVGSTSFAEQVDAETARDTMGRYHAMARATIEANGGSVAKYIGDGVMAIWGIPEVSPDDAERSVAAGLALQEGFAPIGAATEERHGIELGLRVGINTGEVVIADADADIIGDALNTAARLEAACAPGEVVVGQSTWRLTRSTVEYQPLAPVAVKGKAEPLPTFLAVDRAGADAEGSTESSEPLDVAPPFVGRGDDLARLVADFEAATAERSVRLATVIGGPGVGKTRLAAELVATLRASGAPITAFHLRCEEVSRTALAPVGDLLLAAIADNKAGDHDHDRDDAASDHPLTAEDIHEIDGEGPEALLTAIADLLDPAMADRDRLVGLLGSFVGAGEARSTEESFFAVRRLVEELGARRPTVLVVDDIQWAEPLLLDLLEHLAEWGAGGAVLMVGLARPELRTIRPSLTEPGRRVRTVVGLEGLVPAETERLAAELLGVGHLPGDLAFRLPASTEGNPLFVRELVRMLVDDGVIAKAGDTFQLTIDADAVQVPPTIQSLLATRVERLPDDERRVLELAAVVGPEFPRGAVASLAPAQTADELDSILERLRRRDLVEPTGSYWGDEPVLRFHHALIRDAAYRRLLKATRAELHLTVGRWTRETADAVVGHHESAIAVHYEQAYRYRSELGPIDDGIAAIGIEAAELLTEAATRALAIDDLATAGSLSRRALATLGPDDRRRPGLLLIGCESLASSGAVDEARELLASLRAVSDSDRLEAWAICFESQLSLLTDPAAPTPAAAATEGAARRLADLGDEAGVAKARQVRATALARLGRIGECETELDLALAAARAADDGRRVSAVLGAAPLAALWGPSPVPRAGGRCLDVVRLLRITNGSPAVEAVSVRCQGVLEALRGRTDQARRLLSGVRTAAKELGLRQTLYETELYAGFVELLADEPEAAEPHLRSARSGLGRLGIGADAGKASAHLASSLLRQGRLEEAEQLVAEAAEQAGQNLQTVIAAGAITAEILAAQGRFDEALRSAEGAVATASRTDIVVDHAQAVAALARVREAAGDAAGAAEAWHEVTRLAEAKEAPALVPAGVTPRSGSGVGEVERAPDRSGGQRPRGEGDAFGPSTSLRGIAEPMRRALDGITDGLARRDIGLVDDLLGPDFLLDDRRVGSLLERDRDAHLAAIQALFDEGVDVDLTPTMGKVEAPTDRTLLADVTLNRVNDSVTEMLMVVRLTEDGRFERHVVFDPDQLDEARAELIQLGLSELLTEPMVEAWRDIFEAYRTRDLDRFARWLHPRFALDDRRSGVTLERDRDAHIKAVEALFEEDGRLIATMEPRIQRGQHLILGRAAILRGTDARTEFLLVASMVPDDPSHRFDRYVVFDVDATASATAELDRLAGQRESVDPIETDLDSDGGIGTADNQVMRSLRTLLERARPDDLSPYEELVSPSVVREDRRRGVADGLMVGRDAMLEMTASVFATGFRYLDPVVLAQRGERLAIARSGMATAAGDRVEFLGVCRSDPDGRIDRFVFFDDDDLTTAMVELEQLAATAGTRATAVTMRMFDRLDAGDADGAMPLMADDVQQEDRRIGFSFGVVDWDQLRSLARDAVASDAGPVRFDAEVVATAGDDLVLSHLTITRPDGSRSEMLYLARIADDDLIDRVALLDPDNRVGAGVELQRWAGRGPNRAALIVEELLQLTNGLSGAATPDEVDRRLDALVAPGMVRDDRRPGLGFGRIDRDGFIVAMKAFLDLGGRQERVGHLAWRGQDLVLSRYDHHYGPDNRSEMLIVNRFDEADRLDRTVVFDPTQQAEAEAELDRLDTTGR